MRVLTGIQPSGTPHIGNYFGAMKPILDLAQKNEAFIFIADLHAMTTVNNSEELRQNSLNVALDFLALGLDTTKTVFYRQSDVRGHTELAWILSTLAPMGLLERAHSYKDKVAKGLEANVGLFIYPILMAADILLYSAEMVPVGKDQKQHIEITRDLAQKFNHQYGETFVLPEGQISEETATVPGIDGQKMSKSYGNTIEIFAEESLTHKKVMSIQTDSKGIDEPKEYKGNPIYELSKLFMTPAELRILEEKFTRGGTGYGEMKKELSAKINDFFASYRQKRAELAKNPAIVEKILQEGAQKAQAIATEKLKQVRRAVGLSA